MQTPLQKAEALRKEAVSAIQKLVSSKKSRKLFPKFEIEVVYGSCDGGYMGDMIACVENDTLWLVPEGTKVPKNYDFEEDKDGIVSTDISFDDMTLSSLCNVADTLTNKNSFFIRYEELSVEFVTKIRSLQQPVSVVCPITIDVDGRWHNITALSVTNKGIVDDNGIFVRFGDPDIMWGDALISIASSF